MHIRSRQDGFTLIEALIVVSILLIMAAIALPSLCGRAKTPQDAYIACSPQFNGTNAWYFRCDAATFAMAIGQFSSYHPELRIVSVATASSKLGQYAATVITEPKVPASTP